MSRAQEEDRLRAWLKARGWVSSYYGLQHVAVPESMRPGTGGWQNGFSLSEAFQAQQRLEREAATSAREINIRDADVGADAQWREAAMAAIERVAQREREFTTDHVLDEDPTLEQGREPRALGPMMLYAAKDGIIAPTDRYVSSSRKASNARAKRAWRSLIFAGQPARPEATEHLDVLEAVAP